MNFQTHPIDRCRAHAAGLSVLLFSLFFSAPGVARNSSTAVIIAAAETSVVVEQVPLSGTVISARQARLSTQISGLVELLKVDVGERVKKGDEILRLNGELEQLSLQAKRAELEQARQELEDARRRLSDAERLGRNKTVSANEIASLAAEVDIDGTVVKRLQAEQQQQALRVSQHTLKAPFNGIISAKLVEQGEWVQPGEAVVELVDTDRLVIEFQAPQSVYNNLQQVGKVEVRFDAFPRKSFAARIVAVVPVTDRTSRTFLIRAAIDDPALSLIPGMSASAVLHVRKATTGIVIHRNAIIRYPDGRVAVWVVDNDSGEATVSERLVKTGLSFNGRISITSGLQAGEWVVINGNESLREGQSVSVRQAGE